MGDRRKAVQAAQERLQSRCTNVQVCLKGLGSVGLDAKDEEALDKALLKGGCVELFTALLVTEALHANVDVPDSADCTLSQAQRAELLGALPGPPKRALSSVEKAMSAKGSVGGFVDALWAVEATLGTQFARLDKKREKAAHAASRASMREQLAVEADPALVLHLAVVILHLELSGALVEAPGRLLPPLIDALRPKLGDGPHGVLTAYQRAVGAARAAGDGAGGAEEELRAGIEEVRRMGIGRGATASSGPPPPHADAAAAEPAGAEPEPAVGGAAEPEGAPRPKAPKKKRTAKVD